MNAMSVNSPPGSREAALWAGRAGTVWAETQGLMDAVLAPMEICLATAMDTSARRVLDVGCGTGATLLAAAERIGPDGQATGIDISPPMLARARERAEARGLAVKLIEADAQRHDFGGKAFDLIQSRFGVMFFDDPVAAFANLRAAANAGASLRLLTWRRPDENPFMITAGKAARAELPDLPAPVPGEPGQFGLSDPVHVERVLAQAGWSDITLIPVDFDCGFAADQLETYATRLGPVGRIWDQLDAGLQARLAAALHQAFQPFVTEGQVRFTAACWLVEARNLARGGR